MDTTHMLYLLDGSEHNLQAAVSNLRATYPENISTTNAALENTIVELGQMIAVMRSLIEKE